LSHRKRKTQKKFVFSRTRKQAGRRKDREREDTDFAQESMKQE
jgi:hypothetical protein